MLSCMVKHSIDDELKRRVLGAIADGELTPQQVADWLGIHRRQVYRWCEADRINWKAGQARHMALVIARITGKKPPTKAELRIKAKRAYDAWQSHQRDKA